MAAGEQTHSMTQDGCSHSSVLCNEYGNGILNWVNYCLSPCLEEFGQLLSSYWLNLVRRQYKNYAVKSAFVSTKKVKIASFCFSLFSHL